MSGFRDWALLVTALGCGLVAGVFYAFSSFVMPALGRLPAATGTAAMQSINVLAVTPAFMSVFCGTALASLAVAIDALAGGGSAAVVAAALLYLLGTFGLTVVYHVPRNDRLAEADPEADATARLWREYLPSWTAGNHVRAAASLAASALLVTAI
jgi:uncharacterized membrane protein